MALLEPPDYEERILIVGSNGSGKTKFTERLLGAGYPRTVVVDFKREFQHPALLDKRTRGYVHIITSPLDRRLNRGGWPRPPEVEHIVFRPSPQFRTKKYLELFCARMLQRAEFEGRKRPFVVVIDEGLWFAKYRALENLTALVVAGRSLKCSVWIGSQRTKWIPVEIRTEAHRWFVFWLSDEDDEAYVSRFSKGQLSVAELQQPKAPYSFFELRRDLGGPIRVTRYGPIRTSQRSEVEAHGSSVG